MENLLKKDVTFQWSEHQQEILDTVKNKMVTMPIVVFPNWKKEFRVHVDALSVTLNIVLSQLGEGSINHPIAFVGRKL